MFVNQTLVYQCVQRRYETFEKCFPLKAGFKYKPKIPDFEREKVQNFNRRNKLSISENKVGLNLGVSFFICLGNLWDFLVYKFILSRNEY